MTSTAPKPPRHLLTLDDWSADEITRVLTLADDFKRKAKFGERPPLLAGKVLAQIYDKPSLRTRVSFEAAMARLGGFEALGPVASVADLLYVRLREREFYEERLAHGGGRTGEPQSGDDLAGAALGSFKRLVAAYRAPDKTYPSRARPFLAGDYTGHYDHLARAREWSVAAAPEEGDAP